MSKIDKLQIRGVRSFDNGAVETIQFFAPLTLIVGHNGSGKTTIIECLKYATTGDLPPNSKGGAFIHDPKLCGEKEVLAQVKLSFSATSGARMVATRSLQLTVKKTVRTQKTLEGHLLLLKDGERIAVSSRVAELDQILPQYLGVSKAVLDNVVFCHQDESLWPMSEPSLLKKKFDEIFEALKYTKAIDNIKVLRKKQMEELAKFRLIEVHAKETKDKADRADQRSRILQVEMDAMQKQIESLHTQVKDMTVKGDAAFRKRNEFFDIVNELKLKRGEENSIQINVERLKQNLELMHDSDTVLQSMLDQYEERAELYESELLLQKKQYNELKQQLDKNREAIGLKQQELGERRAQRSEHENRIRDRESLIKETARRHNIRGFERELHHEQVHDFMERLSRLNKEQITQIDRAKRETDQEMHSEQTVLNDLNQRKTSHLQTKENIKSQTQSNERKVVNCQTFLDNIKVDEGTKATLETTLSDTQSRLDKLKSDLATSKFAELINENETKIRHFDELKDRLQDEFEQAHKHTAEMARVDLLHKSLKDSRIALETMKGAHGDRITKMFGRHWSSDTLEAQFKTLLETKAAEISDAEQERNGTSRELEQIEFKLNTMKKELRGKTTEARDCEERVQNVLLDGEEYNEALKTLENNREVVKGDIDSFSNMRKYYFSCQQVLEKRRTCRLCDREFKDEKELSKFAVKIQNKISEAAQQTIMDEFQTIDAQYKELSQLRGTYDTWQRLATNEIPHLESEVQRLEPTLEGLLTLIEQQDRVVEERKSARRDVEALSQTIQKIAKYMNDIANFDGQLQDVSIKQSQKGVVRSIETISEQQREVNDQSRAVAKALSSLLSDRGRIKEQIHGTEIEVLDVKAELSGINSQLLDKARIAAEIDGLLAESRGFKGTIKQIDDELQQLLPQITQSQAKLDDIKFRSDERQKVLNEQSLNLSRSLNDLRTIDNRIAAYITQNGIEALICAERELEILQRESARIEFDQAQLAAENNKLKTQQSSHLTTKTSIQNNLTYRQDTKALEDVRAKIAVLESRNAEADRKKWESEANRLSIERGKLDGQRSSLMGELKSKDDQLMQLLQDWNTDFKDAKYKYKEANIKVEATKSVVEDLGRYGGALDKAIMKYHSLKMEEINRIIEELWKRTYQGTDVDTILIRSDNENLKGNKSYNYRVCMVKQDAEMDMRGRCSAGQKVLASIIIRLALAECFGTNCGLIALDEPTTNLDRDNIRALASSLHDIIKARQGQSNFQLIVITHDEEFLRYMQCADFCDHYYRVSRNEKQKSGIERQSIADVME